MPQLAGTYWRHLDTGKVVRVIETRFGKIKDTEEEMKVVCFADESGAKAYYEIESFMLEFEHVGEFRQALIVAPREDEIFWAKVEKLVAEHDVFLEGDDRFAPAASVGRDAVESEGLDFSSAEKLH